MSNNYVKLLTNNSCNFICFTFATAFLLIKLINRYINNGEVIVFYRLPGTKNVL